MKGIDFTNVKKHSFTLGILASSITGFLFTLIPIWQLAFIPGILGGILNSNQKKGTLSGMIGMPIAWSTSIIYYLLLNKTNILFDQLGVLILNQTGMGWLFIVVIILIGMIIGALGGMIGAGINILFLGNKKIKELDVESIEK
ncbi:hypothetical protein NEF87_000888 [Candidatus Lokiarchaeum ossiferum]|uniref:DUF5518 domain-containing protein n=1 Tax=Candidatus Lokiarchaeum ossiferum TaxID=2951803 RepID=A0ABY6HM61_9ARCH|nr:hypothetical protein NEF87_000888 [Candidatus Lokiarchaeum sp. B-35]